jgi:galactokinase
MTTIVERVKNSMKELFSKIFGNQPSMVVRAPGRVEIIGGHTDYNEGYVLPMAIDKACWVYARKRNDNKVRLYSELYGRQCEFELNVSLSAGDPAWANYAKGVAHLLLQAGKKLVGLDMLIHCTVPSGGGLSSSAAIEVGYAKTFLAACGETMNPVDLALLCRKAEHTFANSPCGIMDQFISVMGKKDHALLIVCRSHEYELIHAPFEHASILVADSKVKHNLGESGYPLRRKQCEEAVRRLTEVLPVIRALRDVSLDQLDHYKNKLDDLQYQRAKHAISESDRVLKMTDAFKRSDLIQAGEMMNQSHNSLRDDYEVSCEELDFLVDRTRECSGVYGARMSGGGFGGCMVALVENGGAESISNHLCEAYMKRYGKHPDIFLTGASAGAEILENS